MDGSFRPCVGKGSVVNALEVECILVPTTEETKRQVKIAKDNGRYLPVNRGRKIRSVILMKSGWVMPCMLSYETVMNRLNGKSMIGKVRDDSETPDDVDILEMDLDEEDEG